MKGSIPPFAARSARPAPFVFAVTIGYPGSVRAWRAERRWDCLGFGALVHPAAPKRCVKTLRWVPLERRRTLRNLSAAIGARPNQRLKLAAPAFTGRRFRRRARCATLSGVNSFSARRSLGASR